MALVFSEVAETALVAQILKTLVILIRNFTRPHAITYLYQSRGTGRSSLTVRRIDSIALAMTTATARKTSLGNKHLPNCDYLRLSHLVGVL